MNKQVLLEKLKSIIYPELDKNIVALKCIKSVEIKDKKLSLKLNISNSNFFENIENQIKELLKDDFTDIDLSFTKLEKKDMNYGDTKNPNNRAPYCKKIIAVSSGKGGVGKSTVAVNIAIGLAQLGNKVGLLDADVYAPSVPRMLNLSDEKLTWNDNNKIEPHQNFGIKTMSVGLTTPTADTPLVWRSSVAISALIQFLEDVEWGELDFMVIDMPPGTGDIQLTMAQELPIAAAVIVTTPQRISTDDVSRSIMMFKDIKVKIGGVVENMSSFITPDTKKEYFIFGENGGEDIAKFYDIPFLGKIPLTINIRESSDMGMPAIAKGDAIEKDYYKKIIDNLIKNI